MRFSFVKWFKLLMRPKQRPLRNAQRPRFRPLCELLESRVTPTVSASVSALGSSATGPMFTTSGAETGVASFTVNSGIDRLLVVSTFEGANTDDITAVTYNGQSLTEAISNVSSTNTSADIWYVLLGSGSSITSPVSLTYGVDGIPAEVVATAFQYVNQTTPVSGATSGTSSILGITTATGDLVLDEIASYSSTSISSSALVASVNQTQKANYVVTPSWEIGVGTASGTSPVLTSWSGAATSTAMVGIDMKLAPPAGLTYSANPVVYAEGSAITADTPSSTGGPVASYSVLPALPTGLSLGTGPNLGKIIGTPTVVTAATNYTITAANAAGSTTDTVSIAVVPPTTFTQAGTTLDIGLVSSDQLSIVSNGTSYSLSLGATGIWSGTNSANETGNGTSTLTVTTAGIAALTGGIDITDTVSTGADSVTFNDSSTNSYANSFDITLSNAAAGPITFNGATAFTGTAALSASTTQSITVNIGATVATDSGDLTLSANQQATPTSGSFVGITVIGATVESATGSVLLEGTGGDTGGGNYGVLLQAGLVETTATGGTVTVNGTGGAGAGGGNFGVYVYNGSEVTSGGGDVSVTGQGGGSGDSSYGVEIDSGNTVTSGGDGTVNVQGTGSDADASGASDFGVFVAGTVTSGGDGTVTVQGTGSDAANAGSDCGVYMLGGTVESGGSGTVTVGGTGGAGLGGTNHGVVMYSSSEVTSGGGNVSVTGYGGGAGASDFGVDIYSNSTVTSGGNGTVNVQGTGSDADTSGTGDYGVVVTLGGTVNSGGSGTVTVVGTGGSGIASNVGVYVYYSGSEVSSGGGNVSVTGYGGGVGGNNYGVDVYDSGTITSGSTGTVDVQGTGSTADTTGGSDFGVYLVQAGTITSGGSGKVTVGGTGGSGPHGGNHGVYVYETNSKISSGGGNVSVTGYGGGAGGNNLGVVVNTSAMIEATGSGTVTILGTGSTADLTGDSDYGVAVYNNSEVESGGGNVSITGYGAGDDGSGDGIGYNNRGVDLENTATVTAGSSGTVTIQGTGGDSSGGGNLGVFVYNSSEVTSSGGNVSVTGYGAGAGGGNDGVQINSATVTSGGDGTVNVQGTGSSTDTTGGNGYGVEVVGGGTVNSGGAGTVTVGGTGASGPGGNNFGVYVANPGSAVESGGGDVSITGYGGGAGSNNDGVRLDYNATVTSTSSGTVDVQGTGSDADNTGSTDIGVRIQGGSTVTTAGSGAVTVGGTGGSSTGGTNLGVYVGGSSSTVSSDGGDVSVTGYGAGTGGNNDGIRIEVSATVTSTGSGTVDVQGTGSTADTTGSTDIGVRIQYGATVTSAGSGTVTVVGTGGSSPNGTNLGVYVASTGTEVSSGGGDVSITGYGGGAGNNNDGVRIESSATVTSTLSGTVDVQGTGSDSDTTGGGDLGVRIQGGATVTSAGSGTVTVGGTGGSGPGGSDIGVYLGDSGTEVFSGGGNVSVTGYGSGSGGQGEGVQINGATVTSGGDGTVNVQGTGSTTDTTNGNSDHGVYIVAGGTVNSGGSGTVTVGGTAGSGPGGSDLGVYIVNSGSEVTSGGGDVSVTGYGGGAGSQSEGVQINGAVVTSGGDGTVDVQGTGSTADITGNSDHGVYLLAGGTVSSGGSGAVTVGGTGGAGPGGSNFGVYLFNSGSEVTSGGGNVSITGYGGGVGSNGYGVMVNNGATVTSGDGGTVNIQGTGSTADITGNSDHGVYVVDGGTVNSGGSGAVTVGGTGGTGSGGSNFGVYVVNSGSEVTSGGGDVSITGVGGGAGGNSYGILVNVSATVTAGDSGTVTIQGTGSSADTTGAGDHGVYLGNSGSVTSNGGNVSITGQGGAGPQGSNRGIQIDSGGTVNSGTGGSVTILGTGGDATGGYNIGIYMDNSGSAITSGGGNVSIIGRGSGSGGNNWGVGIDDHGNVSAGNGGTVTLQGTGSTADTTSGNSDFGIYVTNSATVTSSGGAVTLSGIAGGDLVGNGNIGIYVTAAGQVSSGSGGAITITGVGGPGSPNDDGVQINGGSSQVLGAAVSPGLVTIIGRATDGAGSRGIYLVNGGDVSSGGNVTLIGLGGYIQGDNSSFVIAAQLTTRSTGGATLYGPNAVSAFTAQNGAGGDITLTNTTAALTLNGISNSGGGNVNISNTGDITAASAVNGAGGNVTLTADSNGAGTGALTINGGVGVYGGNITLRGDNVTIAPTATVGSASTVAPAVSTFVSGLNAPQSLAFDASGNLYVANQGTGTVNEYTSSGTLLNPPFASGLSVPVGLAFDASGNLYVTDQTSGTVSEYSSTGTPLNPTFASGLNKPQALAFDADGNLYVANYGDGTVSEYSSTGTLLNPTFASGLNKPEGLAFDASGDLYVADLGSGTVSEYSSTDTLLNASFASGLNEPTGLAFDASGNLYVANYGSGTGATVSEYSPTGTLLNSSFVSGLNAPDYLAFDASGDLYVTNYGNNGDGTTVSEVTPAIAATSSVTIQSSVESQPIIVGGNVTPANTVSITSAELAQIFTTATGTLTFGDGGETGNITFVNAAPATTPGASIVALQYDGGAGQIILDSGGSVNAALNGNGGNVSLTAGTGGIVEAGDNVAGTPDIAATGIVKLNTTGPIGTTASPIQFDAVKAPSSIVIGDTDQPSSAYLYGLGSLTLGDITGSTANTTLDAAADNALTVAVGAIIDTGAGTLTLAADANANGSGNANTSKLSILSDSVVVSANSAADAIDLRGYDVDVDTGSNPAIVGARRSVSSVVPLPPLARPEFMAYDSSGDLFIANNGNGTVAEVVEGTTTAVPYITTGLNQPEGLAFDASGDLFISGLDANYNSIVSEVLKGSTTPTTVVTGLSYPQGLVFDALGDLFIANNDNGTVSEVRKGDLPVVVPGHTTPATATTVVTGLNGPYGITFDSAGDLFIANGYYNGIVSEVTASELPVVVPGSTTPATPTPVVTGLYYPQGLVFDSSGDLLISGHDSQYNGIVSGAAANELPVLPGNTTPATVTTVIPGLNNPEGLIFDSSGNLLIANTDAHNNAIVSEVLDGDLPPLPVGPVSTFVSGLTNPLGLAFHAGNLYVTDNTGDTVSVYDPSGTLLGSITSGLNEPFGLAFDASGNLYVANSGDGTVSAYGSTGTLLGSFVSGLTQPTGLAFDAGGDLYVADASLNTVSVYSSLGTLLGSITSGLNEPYGLVFDASGNLYVANYGSGTVSEYSSTGTLLNPTFASGLSNPVGLAFDLSGNLYVTERYLGTVSEFSSTGTPLGSFAPGLNQPGGLAFDSSGNLYVANYGSGTVSEALANELPVLATPVTVLVAPTFSLNGNPGGVAFDPTTGNLFVADSNNGEVDEMVAGSDTFTPFITGLDYPVGLAFDSSGDLFIADAYNGINNGEVFEVAAGQSTATAVITSGIYYPYGLAIFGGDLFIANQGNNSNDTVSEVPLNQLGNGTPATPTTAVTGVNYPQGLAFDASGDLFIAGQDANYDPIVAEVPAGDSTPTTVISGLAGYSIGLAFDAQGNLFIAGGGGMGSGGQVQEVFKGSSTASSFLSGLNSPDYIAFDASGKMYLSGNVSNSYYSGSVFDVTTDPVAGGVMIQSSQSSDPMSIGGSNNAAVAGINLTSAELARIVTASTGTVTFGDSNQTGNITFDTATPATTAGAATVVMQSSGGAGQIILDNTTGGTGIALNGNGGNVSLTAGTGGIVEAATNVTGTADIGNAGTVALTSAGIIGTSGQPLQIRATSLTTASNGGTSVGGATAVANFGATNATGGNISLTDAANLVVTGITQSAATGTVSVSVTGGSHTLTVHGGVSGAGGNITLQAAGSGGIILDDTNGIAVNGNGGTVTLTPGTGGLSATASANHALIAANGFSATGLPLNLTLNFAPTLGQQITLVHDTGSPISGNFTGLAPGGVTTASYDGTLYGFAVNYTGGAGNDLVLTTIFTTDTKTQGNWQGAYGVDGENVIGSSAASYPAYATVSTTGISTWTWSASTSNVSALQLPGGSGRIADCWFAKSSFTINVNLTDGLSHDVSLYLVDFDKKSRSESVEVTTAAGAVLSAAQTVSSFSGGEYVTWNLRGNVKFVITKLAGPNAVVSGIFFGAPPEASFVESDTTTKGSWIKTYGSDGENVIGSPASYPGYAQVSATGNSKWTWAASTTTVSALQQPAPATGRVADAWYASSFFDINVDLTDGLSHDVSLYIVDYSGGPRTESIAVTNAAGVVLSPAQTVSNFTGGEYLTWNVTGDVEFLITKVSGPNAVVSGIFFGVPTLPEASFVATDTTTKGSWIGTYGPDGENVIGSSGPSYPTYATVSMTGNSLWTWAASTTTVSALQQPAPANGRVADAWYALNSFTINVDLTDGLSHNVSLYVVDYDEQSRSESIEVTNAAGVVLSPPQTVSSFSGGEYLTWNVTGDVEFVITKVSGPNAVVSGIFFGVPTLPEASFVATDTTTQGSWVGVYGAQGENVIGSSGPSYPTYAKVSATGNSNWTWAASTTTVSALQQPAPATGRVAAAWYALNSFTINVDLTDGLPHNVSLYVVDYDEQSRSESIEVTNAAGVVLSPPQTVSSFSGGEHLTWNVMGDVEFVITNVSGPNAVVSGIFFNS